MNLNIFCCKLFGFEDIKSEIPEESEENTKIYNNLQVVKPSTILIQISFHVFFVTPGA